MTTRHDRQLIYPVAIVTFNCLVFDFDVVTSVLRFRLRRPSFRIGVVRAADFTRSP
jgi:hypothetical protein